MRGNISKNKNGQGEMIQTLESFDYDDLDTLTDVGVYAVRMPFDNVSSLCYLFVSVQASEGTDDSNRAYITNTYSQFLMSSDALKSRSQTIKTYKDNGTQSAGKWSEWKTTEGAITKTVINYEAIDSCCNCGVYFVEGRTAQISEGSAETLIVSSAGRVFCQYYFYDDGRVEYRQQQNGEWPEWKSVGVTSYNDLTDKPINSIDWINIDLLYGRENDGVYKVSGKSISGIVGMGNSTGYLMVTTNVDGNELQTCQHYIDSTGKIQYRIGTGTNIDDWSEWKSIGGGSDLNIVDDIDSISGDEEKEVVPSARAVKLHTSFIRNDVIGYVDRNIINKIVNDLTVPVSEDAIPTARCTQKYIQDTASEIVAYVDGSGFASKDELADVAKSGKYEDLVGEPITILSTYPKEEVLNSLGRGMFYWKSDYFTDSVLIISSDNEDWLVTDDNVNYKQERWTQIIISESGIRKRQKINNRAYDDNRQETTIDWRYVPLDESLATKEYVDSAIGDIETSLENIIKKYGLGGDGV